jgi:pimeloyl-ACP methyl ester carboxylesterase
LEDIDYSDTGAGTPVILLHGFMESRNMWDELSNRLNADYRVLCPNLPGFGNTPLPKDPITIDLLALAIKNWLHHLNINKCVLMGHSLGGYITLSFAEQFPESLLGFGLIHSTAYADSEEKKHNRDKMVRFIKKYGVQKFVPEFIPLLFHQSGEKIQNIIDELVAESIEIKDECVINYALAMKNRPDRTHLLKKQNTPILFVAGENDSLMSKNDLLAQSRNLDPEFVIMLKKSGHMGMFEEQDQFYMAIAGFLRSIDLRLHQ